MTCFAQTLLPKSHSPLHSPPPLRADTLAFRQHAETALYLAAAGKNPAAAQVLVAAGADPHSPTVYDHGMNGRTPLHVAANNGRVAIVALLLADPRVNPSAEDGVRARTAGVSQTLARAVERP